jgi:hypothetical protein
MAQPVRMVALVAGPTPGSSAVVEAAAALLGQQALPETAPRVRPPLRLAGLVVAAPAPVAVPLAQRPVALVVLA